MTMQLSFDMLFTDAVTQEVVPWQEYSQDLINEIYQAPWKICDLETTGLNPASEEQNFGGKDLRRGIDPKLRLRVCSILYPKYIAGASVPYAVVSFDFDKLTLEQKKEVCVAVYSKVLINHNVGFDAYWLAIYAGKNKPDLLLDTMLIARAMKPEQILEFADLCSNEDVDFEISQAARDAWLKGKSGWALAELVLTCFHRVVEKGMQGPKNWAEPFLSQQAYDYATGDTIEVFNLFCHLFKINIKELSKNPHHLIDKYQQAKFRNPTLDIIEPQVLDIVAMRIKGMPWLVDAAEEYIRNQQAAIKEIANKISSLCPALQKYAHDMASLDKGITADFKQAIGDAFSAVGVSLDTTSKTGAYKIGEKDLRRVRAAKLNDASKELFNLWVSLNKAKKAANMAKEVSKFAIRSEDGRLHPNTGHGPVTGRLSSSEPNCQQFPRDQNFRACVRAATGYKIIASDYSALDMRVGGALAIRAQEHIWEVFEGKRLASPEVTRSIVKVLSGAITFDKAVENEKLIEAKMRAHKASMEDTPSRSYWDTYRKLKAQLTLTGFERCLANVRDRAKKAGTKTWGSLRDAFNIPGMDIHTWTALGMTGQDPVKIFSGLDDKALKAALKAKKAELGDTRQTGKVGNLSLLYAMTTNGLVDTAAKNYNIHWSYDEADLIRKNWLESYVEIDLWHKWTELNKLRSVMVPDIEKKGQMSKKDIYASYTLGNRLIYATGLNAALSYEDQSTGADILGRVMFTFREKYPDLFSCIINQVHDEIVFEVPENLLDEYMPIISDVMTDCAEHFLMPFGVHGECSPAVGDVWLKD